MFDEPKEDSLEDLPILPDEKDEDELDEDP